MKTYISACLERNECFKIFFAKRLAKFEASVILVSEVKRGDENEKLQSGI